MSQPAIIRWDQAYNRNGDASLPRAVLNVIRTYMDNHTLEGWVRQETLANATGLTDRQVRRHITDNVNAGWLSVTKRGRSGQASEYRLAFPQPDVDVRLEDALPDMDVRLDLLDVDVRLDPNRTHETDLPDTDVRFQPDMDVLPTTPATTPRTSPKEKFLERTTPLDQPDVDVRLAPDPFGGSVLHPPPTATAPWLPDMDVRLDASRSDPFAATEGSSAAPATPEGRLLAHLAANGDRPLHQVNADYIVRLTPTETTTLLRKMSTAKQIVVDRDTGIISLP